VSGGRGPALLALLALLTFLPASSGAGSSAEELVHQLQMRGIRNERVLESMRRVPRDEFVPAAVRARAYDDVPLDIGHGRTMPPPYLVALMTEELGLRGNERVLEIGTGSGYGAAILAVLAREVYSVELVSALARGARLRLTRVGYRNVHVKQGDGTLGWREYGPYDAVVVTAAAPSVPRALVDQLREGGVLVMPLGEPDGRQVLIRGVKRGIKLRAKEVAEVRFVPLLSGGSGAAEPVADPARRSPARGFTEEELPPQDGSSPESDRRPPRAARTRAARAPSARDSDRRCEARAVAFAAVGFPATGRRSAA
jgi:protein-L-isoaspartate(D-aspartate) O-methyltransferase